MARAVARMRSRTSSGSGAGTVIRRGDRFVSLTNFAGHPVRLPPGELLLAGDELEHAADGALELPPDSTAWLRLPHQATEIRHQRKARR
jgi:hypothetical protein